MNDIEDDRTIRVTISTATSTHASNRMEPETKISYSDVMNAMYLHNFTRPIPTFPPAPAGFAQAIPIYPQVPVGFAPVSAEFVQNMPVSIQELILGYLGDPSHTLYTSLYDDELRRDPTIKLNITQRNCRTTDIEHDCSICQNKFVLGEKLCTLEECQHNFHYKCIDDWGKYKQECPLCRISIPVLER